MPEHLRSDNGPEFVAKPDRHRLARVNVETLNIEPGSPWENGYCESFNGKLRDEFLNGELFYTLKEAQVPTEQWRRNYNGFRPHSALGYQPPAPQALSPHQSEAASTPLQRLQTGIPTPINVSPTEAASSGQATSTAAACALIDDCAAYYDTVRVHSSPGYLTPAA